MRPTHKLKKSSNGYNGYKATLARKIAVEFYVEPIHLEMALQRLIDRGSKISKKAIFDEAKYQFYMCGGSYLDMNEVYWPTDETKDLCKKLFSEYYEL